MNRNVVDDNKQCPYCHRWFSDGYGLGWHIRAKHSPESEQFHKLFSDNAYSSARKRAVKRA